MVSHDPHDDGRHDDRGPHGHGPRDVRGPRDHSRGGGGDNDRNRDHNPRDGDGDATTSNRTGHKDGSSTMVGLLLARPARRRRLVPMQKKRQAL
jgi:hypothetical protein